MYPSNALTNMTACGWLLLTSAFIYSCASNDTEHVVVTTQPGTVEPVTVTEEPVRVPESTADLADNIRATRPVGNEPIIPIEELPGPGDCRIWYPGQSPLEQPSSGACDDLMKKVPAGAWLVYRPADTPQFIQIRQYPAQTGGTVVVKNYDARTGAYIGPGE